MSIKHVNKKAIKVFHYWFCSRCLQKLDMSLASSLDLFGHYEDPNVFSNALAKIGLKLTCKICGNTVFVKKEFEVPIEDIVTKELEKQIKEYTSNNGNPTRRT